MTNKPAELLNELIELVRDGERFYLDAANKVSSIELQGIFREMAEVRQHLIADLSQHVLARGERPSDERTLAGRLRKLYADVRAALRTDQERIYVNALEEAEDRLLDHYRAALRDPPSEKVREILERHLLTIQAAHDSMRALKLQVEAG